MKRKGILALTLSVTIITTSSAGMVKAEEMKSNPMYKIIRDVNSPVQGIVTNVLKPYILNEKEINTVFMNSVNDIERLKLQEGYYVFENEKYDIEGTDVYVMISLGKRNTTGYGIKIVSAEDIEGISKITIQETKPSPDMMVGQAITYPYVIVRLSQATPNVKVVTEDGAELSPLSNSSEVEEKGWSELEERWDVSPDKVWLITFKSNISKAVINEDTIYVRDRIGVKFPVEVVLGDDKKTARVVPLEKYREGQEYYLFISNKMYSKNGIFKRLKGYRMKFTIEGEVTVRDVE